MSTAASARPLPGVIRYMGNKTAVIGPLRAAVERLCEPGALVVDPMAGSQAVTVALKDRHRLVASDAQEYSAVIGRGWLENVSVRHVDEALLCRLEAAVEDELASSPNIGAISGSSLRFAVGLGFTPAIAPSVTSAARTGWTTPSSATP